MSGLTVQHIPRENLGAAWSPAPDICGPSLMLGLLESVEAILYPSEDSGELSALLIVRRLPTLRALGPAPYIPSLILLSCKFSDKDWGRKLVLSSDWELICPLEVTHSDTTDCTFSPHPFAPSMLCAFHSALGLQPLL